MLCTCNNYSNSLARISRVLFNKNLQWPEIASKCKKETMWHCYASKNLLRDVTFGNETVGTPRWYVSYCQELHKAWQLLCGQKNHNNCYIYTYRTISFKEYMLEWMRASTSAAEESILTISAFAWILEVTQLNMICMHDIACLAKLFEVWSAWYLWYIIPVLWVQKLQQVHHSWWKYQLWTLPPLSTVCMYMHEYRQTIKRHSHVQCYINESMCTS